MSDLLQKLDKNKGDVVLMRACLLEDLEKTQPDIFKRYRVLNEKKTTCCAASTRRTCIPIGLWSQRL